MADTFSRIEEAVTALADGRVVIVVDAQDRENEGDFICAATKVTPAVVHFMIAEGRGLLCVPLLPDLARRLDLAMMVEKNTSRTSTPFMVPIDHLSCRTGVSPTERARTIQAILDSRARPEDFVRPGHVLPLLAKEGGVLRRAGHTEAAVDLARLAGLPSAAVLCEICSRDGEHMAGPEELHALARRYALPIISIEDLIRFRRRTERLVHRQAETHIPTEHYGELRVIGYSVDHESQTPLAIIVGRPEQHAAPLVRMHSSCFTGDLLDSLRCDCGDQLHMALDVIAREGNGVIVYLPQEGRGIGLIDKLKAYSLQDKGLDTVEANLALGYKADMRDYGVGIQILKDLGLSKVRLLTNNPKKTDAFIYHGFDLHVVAQVPIIASSNEHRADYLAAKRDKLGHHLPKDDARSS